MIYSVYSYFSGRHYQQHSEVSLDPYLPVDIFTVEYGKNYYFRVVCSSLTYAFEISIDNHLLHVVSADGRPIQQKSVNSLIISSGERYDFWISANDPKHLGSYWIRAETLGTKNNHGERILANRVQAILSYGNYTYKDPISAKQPCTSDKVCLTLNCPYEIMPPDYHTKCLNLHDIASTVPDYTPWAEGDEVMDIFLDLEIAPTESGGTHPMISGIKNKFPAYPAMVI